MTLVIWFLFKCLLVFFLHRKAFCCTKWEILKGVSNWAKNCVTKQYIKVQFTQLQCHCWKGQKCFVRCLQTGKEVYEGWRSLGVLYGGWQLNTSIAPCKEIQDILGFWIAFCWFWIPGTVFQSLSVELGFWIPMFSACGIPDSLSCIPDSNTKNSKFHKRNFPGYTGSGFYYMGRLPSNIMNGYSVET